MFAEGIVSRREDILEIRARGPMLNTLDVYLHPDIRLDEERFNRFTLTSSSCGVCGKTSVDLVNEIGVFIHRPGLPSLSKETIFNMSLTRRALSVET